MTNNEIFFLNWHLILFQIEWLLRNLARYKQWKLIKQNQDSKCHLWEYKSNYWYIQIILEKCWCNLPNFTRFLDKISKASCIKWT